MEKKVLLIDNYDSFAYNLVHSIEKILGYDIDVVRNDKFDIDEVVEYEYIFISPGPGIPSEAGQTLELVKKYYSSKKIFGVCLGLQSIVVALGGTLQNLQKVYHGIESEMHQTENESIIFNNVEKTFIAGRYHSWVAEKTEIPSELTITAVDDSGEIMALQHNEFPLYAVQFHPESIMTPDGELMIKNFLSLS